ncbi:Flavodoxin [Lachnospiraceae bacterium TWA4]|nr:Flavodoxin [Lachnospiraceae bacterium TWA4]
MSKTLVAYFSASGVTAGVAKKLANVLGADVHEIVPQEKYTDADLDWTNKKSRSSIEMNDKAFRPAIANKVENMEQYDKIYIGFPIWWYTAPTIINTFLEQYNMDEKTVVPFATSGSSQMGKTNDDLRKSCTGAILKEGKRFDAGVSKSELKCWTDNV